MGVRATTFRVVAFAVLVLFAWSAWWFTLTERLHSAAIFWVALCSLFAWTFVVNRVERSLAWFGWLSVLAMILLGIWLPGR